MILLCDDIDQTVADLTAKGVEFTGGIDDQGWGRVTAFLVPGGGEMQLYEPKHPAAIGS